MAELDSHYVKRGMWTNLSNGPIMGKVITTDTRTGTLVIALLAILSSLGTAHLWHLIAFGFHQWRADGRVSDGLFRQQQALLRSLPTPSSLMADSAKLWWTWRQRSDRAFARSFGQYSLALFCAVGSIAASISSSYVVDSSNLEVLVSSPFCARVNTTIGQSAPFRSYVSTSNSIAEPYAQECYRNSTILPARCNAFSRPRVPLKVERVACPFVSNMCVGADTNPLPAVAIDSGLVDINDGFGLNIPGSDRVKFRKRTTCTVLPMAGFTTVINASNFPEEFIDYSALPSEQLMLFHYGERPGLGDWHNTTVAISFVRTNVSSEFGTTGFTHYSSPIRKEAGNIFELLPEMQRDDSDITLMMVTKNRIKYTSPVDDLLFSAHKEIVKLDGATYQNMTYYGHDDLGTGVGCTQQYQFCMVSGNGDTCSELGPLPAELTVKDFPEARPMQLSALQLLVTSSYLFDLTNNQALNVASKKSVGTVIYSEIPADQWIVEVKGWESYVWASLQFAIADYAIGPRIREPEAAEVEIKPTTPVEQRLCGMQKMRKTGGFVNINVFGMAFIVTLSCVIALVDISMLKFLIFLSRFRKALSPRIDRWIQDGVLQLQRRAYEAQGEGVWEDLNKDVPFTLQKEKLSDLPIASLPIKDWKNLKSEQSQEFMLRKANTERTVVASPSTPTSSKGKFEDEIDWRDRTAIIVKREQKGVEEERLSEA